MKHEIIEAIEQGKPFAFGGHKLIAIPYDNTLDDVCDNCEMNRLCQGEISKLCDEINDQFLDCMYLAIIPDNNTDGSDAFEPSVSVLRSTLTKKSNKTMTDKDKIRTEVERCISDYNHWKNRVTDRCSWVDAVTKLEDTLEHISKFIDSLPEEKASEDLDKFATQSANKLYPPEYEMADDNWKQRAGYVKGCKDGAKWQKEQMMKDAIEVYVCTNLDKTRKILCSTEWGGRIPWNAIFENRNVGDKVKLIIVKED